MLSHNVENLSKKPDEVELSRRSFFSRLAVGAVLSIAMPGAVHAAKSTAVKADKNQRLAQQSGRSAVRLPKQTAINTNVSTVKVTNKGVRQSGKLVKSAAHPGHSNTQKAVHTDQHGSSHSRVRDVYTGKKHNGHNNATSHYASRQHNYGERIQLIEPEQQPLFLANNGRFSTYRTLAIQNPHTGDKLNLTYFEKGRYLNDALDEISFLLRDHRSGDTHPIDPALLDQLHDLKEMLDLTQPFDIICGYRSPLTNAILHAEHYGVANNSLHMQGRAVDIRIERFGLRRIHNAAIALRRGGVGYYPGSNFIHLDTGSFRTWSM